MSTLAANAQQTYEFKRHYGMVDVMGNPTNYDVGYTMDHTTDGGFIVAGSTRPNGSNRQYLYLAKTNNNGQLEWSKGYQWGLGNQDSGIVYSVKQSFNGTGQPDGYIMTGTIYYTTPGPWLPPSTIFVHKVDMSGTPIWTKEFAKDQNHIVNEGREVIQTSDGGYIVVGGVGYPVNPIPDCFSSCPPGVFNPNFFNGDIAMIKLRRNGNLQWSRYITEPVAGSSSLTDHHRYDWAYAIREIPQEGGALLNTYVVAGVRHKPFLFAGSAFCNILGLCQFPATQEEPFMFKFTEDGVNTTVTWFRRYPPTAPPYNEQASGFFGLEWTSESRLVATGYVGQTSYRYIPTVGHDSPSAGLPSAGYDVYTVKTNTWGIIGGANTWAWIYSGSGTDISFSVDEIATGYAFCGITNSIPLTTGFTGLLFETDPNGVIGPDPVRAIDISSYDLLTEVRGTMDGKIAASGYVNLNNGDALVASVETEPCRFCSEFTGELTQVDPLTFVEEVDYINHDMSPYRDIFPDIELEDDNQDEVCEDCHDNMTLSFNRHFSAGTTNVVTTDQYGRVLPNATGVREIGTDGMELAEGGYIATGFDFIWKSLASAETMLLKTDSDGNQIWNTKFSLRLIPGQNPPYKTFGYSVREVLPTTSSQMNTGYAVGGDVRQILAELPGGACGDWTDQESWMFLHRADATGAALWARRYGANETLDYCRSVWNTTDGSGNHDGYFLTGFTNGNYGNQALTGQNVYLVKTDVNGTFTGGPTVNWEKIYGSGGNDVAFDGRETSDGGYVVVGWTNGFNGGGDDDALMFKVNADGTIASGATCINPSPTAGTWAFTHGEVGRDERLYDVQEAPDGSGALAAVGIQTSNGQSDILVIRTMASGFRTSANIYNLSPNDSAYGVDFTPDRGLIVTGVTQTTNFGLQAFLMKLDCFGEVEWTKTYPNYDASIPTAVTAFSTGTAPDGANSVVRNSDGGYFTVGYTQGYDAFNGWECEGDLLLSEATCSGFICESEDDVPSVEGRPLICDEVELDMVDADTDVDLDIVEYESGDQYDICEEIPTVELSIPVPDHGSDGIDNQEEGTSSVRGLDLSDGSSSVEIYPVPVRRGTDLTLHCMLGQAMDLDITVVDLLGRTVYTSSGSYGSGEHLERIATTNWAPGHYVVTLRRGGVDVATREVVVID